MSVKKGVLDGLNTMAVFTDTIPSNGKKFKYRGYSAGEEQALLVAKESRDLGIIIHNTKECISACTFGEVDPDKLTSFDIEYILLVLRSKSVGDDIELTMICNECSKKNDAVINIQDINKPVVIKDAHIIKLSDKLTLVMRYPGFEILESIQDPDADSFKLIASLIDQVVNGDDVIETSSLNPEEVERFVKGMSSKLIKHITDFIQNSPALTYELKLKCAHCGHDNVYHFKGIRNFFA